MSQMSSYHFICVRYTRILNFEAKSYVRRIACSVPIVESMLKRVAVSRTHPQVFKCIDDGVVQSHKEEVSYGRLRVFQVFFIMCKMSKKFP